MRKVKRSKIPSSLEVNGASWTQELLVEVKIKGSFSKVSDTLKNKYNQPDVRDALQKMYNEKCCYCENGIGVESYEHIEHLKPKALPQFHYLTYDWNNLHWCCQKCNMAKGNKWDDHDPIVDPTVDKPQDFIEFDVVTGKMLAKNDRGKTLIKHADLNRPSLIKARTKIADEVMKLIVQTKSTPSPSDEMFYRNYIMTFTEEDADFATFIKQLVHTYL